MKDSNEAGHEASQKTVPSTLAVYLPRRTAWVLVGLLAAPWVFLALWTIPSWKGQLPQPPRAGLPHAQDDRIIQCAPGPWGDVEYTRVVIAPPDEFISMDVDEMKTVQWYLPGYTTEMLNALWTRAGLSADQQRSLMDTMKREPTGDMVILSPSSDLILGFNPEARAIIYSTLGGHSQNVKQVNPYRFRADVINEWFENSGLDNGTIALVKRLQYRQGNAVLFADMDTAFRMLPSRDEKALLLKTLSRTSTVLARLRVMPDSDINALVAYWGQGRRAKDLNPLLASLPKVKAGYTIDVAHLLPMFARKYLYTYPVPEHGEIKPNRNCYWTSLNFFREMSEDRYFSLDAVRSAIETDYYPIMDKPTFGDLALFIRSGALVDHACIYVADDLMFTKNGPEPYIPWSLMTLDDLKAIYSSVSGSEVKYYRSRR